VRFAIWLIAALALGQPRPECDVATERLHSDSPREKAWGAHLAATCGLVGLASDISDQLVQEDPEQLPRLNWDSEGFWMAHAFLDALIELRPTLDDSSLNSIARGFPDAAAILMLQNPSAHQEALAKLRLRTPVSFAWVAASNALASMKSRGFAAALFRETRISHRVVITESEACCSVALVPFAEAPSSVQVPSDFPPTYFHRLVAKPVRGDAIVADGRTPIYEQRLLLQPGIEVTMPGRPERFINLQSLRIDYMSQLSGLPPNETEIAVEPLMVVSWSANLDADISRELEKQVTAMNHLAKALLHAGALDASELPMTLKIDVTMENRTGKPLALPEVPPHSFVLSP